MDVTDDTPPILHGVLRTFFWTAQTFRHKLSLSISMPLFFYFMMMPRERPSRCGTIKVYKKNKNKKTKRKEPPASIINGFCLYQSVNSHPIPQKRKGGLLVFVTLLNRERNKDKPTGARVHFFIFYFLFRSIFVFNFFFPRHSTQKTVGGEDQKETQTRGGLCVLSLYLFPATLNERKTIVTHSADSPCMYT